MPMPRAAMAMSCLAISGLPLIAAGEDDREAELRGAVESLGQAFREADVAALEGLLTDDYVHVNGGSGNVIGRDDWLAWVGSRRPLIESGELRITAYRMEDLKIVMHGDTAVVVGAVHATEIRDGEPRTIRVRFSNTWVHEGSRWKRAAFHDSALP